MKDFEALHRVCFRVDSKTSKTSSAGPGNLYGTTLPQSTCPGWIAGMAEPLLTFH